MGQFSPLFFSGGTMILVYLRIALFFGFVEHVYKLADRWGGNSNNTRRYGAAVGVQKELQKRGFHQCPFCFWSTRRWYDHLERGSGWCYTQSERSFKRQDKKTATLPTIDELKQKLDRSWEPADDK